MPDAMPIVELERDPTLEDFIGKTVKHWDFSSCNIWRFVFTDGTSLAIEAEVMNTQYGGVPFMQICEVCGEIPNDSLTE